MWIPRHSVRPIENALIERDMIDDGDGTEAGVVTIGWTKEQRHFLYVMVDLTSGSVDKNARAHFIGG